LQVDRRVNPTIDTVATTRIRSKEDVLIMRPFSQFLFQRGLVLEGPDLLLQKLRGEEIDWVTVSEARRPCAPLSGLPANLVYSNEQWELVRANKSGMYRGCKHGLAPKRQRKLDAQSLEKFECH
jgi:hypothetical protein